MDVSEPAEIAANEQAPLSPSTTATDEWRWSWPARIGFFYTGVIVPIICFIGSGRDGIFPIIGRRWQSGSMDVYIGLLLSWKASSVLYPFLIYSMVSLTLLVVRPARFYKKFVVRFGIYTGVWIALQYWIFILIGGNDGVPANWSEVGGLFEPVFYSLLAVFIPWGIGWLIHFLAGMFGRTRVWTIAVALGAIAWFVFLQFSPDGRGSLTFVLFGELEFLYVFSLFFGTSWAFAAYGTMAWYLIFRLKGNGPRFQFGLLRLFGVMSWLIAYLGAWRTSINIMLAEYAKLPTENPGGCYVATAAARGHSCVVHSEGLTIDAGMICPVNDQMRYLKCAELVLRHTAPRLHRACRWIYNRLGPRLAASLVHPLLADAAYLSLKPAEWFARLALAVLLPGYKQQISGIYRGRGHATCKPMNPKNMPV